ncbi:MAG: HEPN domain-containing protein [Candidatus Helarchaeota archaeon]
MKRSHDWLNQAVSDLKAAESLLNNGNYSWACFLSQQSAEKSIKALYEEFNIQGWGHDLQDLLYDLKNIINIPIKVENACLVLNLYYISTRYPDAFTSGYPSQKFSKFQAEEAIKLAEEVIQFARKNIK